MKDIFASVYSVLFTQIRWYPPITDSSVTKMIKFPPPEVSIFMKECQVLFLENYSHIFYFILSKGIQFLTFFFKLDTHTTYIKDLHSFENFSINFIYVVFIRRVKTNK